MAFPSPLFTDRAEAGRQLAERFVGQDLGEVIVYALPRGGVPVALEIARALNAPLDLVLVRKIGAPGQPELAVAAVVDGDDPQVVLNDDIVRATGATRDYLAREGAREIAEIERRKRLYFSGRPRPSPKGRTVIVVDDGLATGATARIAIQGLRRQGAMRIILAVPVAPRDTVAAIRPSVDQLVCLAQPAEFWGVGSFYADFHQLTDEEVIRQLDQAAAFGKAA